ncbi:hypothetical protein [Kocuria turfanensis]|uniref:Uncharacterized protein n=1 Tax=Kocuria turfanensis TaxID=388357 RepID=A0A512I885_9MICC|nr:hypothetical protein [Kocuria turfanensis]GEO93918.1 hypothetical protein KTU01_00410 [Kocuria turfanensis]
MTCPAPPDDADAPGADAAAPAVVAPATVVDLAAGAAHITPVVVDGEARYAVDLPDQPLDEDDVTSLAVALQVAQAGPAVLVDVEEYLELEENASGAGDPRP